MTKNFTALEMGGKGVDAKAIDIHLADDGVAELRVKGGRVSSDYVWLTTSQEGLIALRDALNDAIDHIAESRAPKTGEIWKDRVGRSWQVLADSADNGGWVSHPVIALRLEDGALDRFTPQGDSHPGEKSSIDLIERVA